MLVLKFFRSLQSLLSNKSLYNLGGETVLKRNEVKHPQFTSPAFPFVLASLFNEGFHAVQITAPAGKRPKIVEFDNERSALSRPGAVAEVEPCGEKQYSLVYRAEALRHSSVDSFTAKKRKASSSVVTSGRQSRKAMRDGESEAGVAAWLGSLGKTGEVIGAKPAESGTLRLEAQFAFQVLKLSMEAYCFVRDARSSELGDPHGLETGCVLSG